MNHTRWNRCCIAWLLTACWLPHCHGNEIQLRGSLRSLQDGTTTSAGGEKTTLKGDAQNPTDNIMYGQPISFSPITTKDSGKVANIVGGSDANPTEAPYQVIILYWNVASGDWESTGCGGSLITNKHVMTAAHCAMNRGNWMDAVYVGAYQPFLGNPGVDFFFSRVSKYTIHPDFSNGPNSNDVAIITMQDEVDTSKFKPVKVASSSYTLSEGETLTVYGFGRTKETSTALVQTLQKAQVPYISQSKCDEKYFPGQIEDNMFCAGYAQGGIDACQGDSGGPLVVKSNGVATQVGIVSWGSGCAQPDKPGVYASVMYLYDWIQKTACAAAAVDAVGLCASTRVASSNGGGGGGTNTQQSFSSSSLNFPQSFSGGFSTTKTSTTKSTSTSSTCKLKANRQRCYFGGECCSGICGYVTSTSGAKVRVCRKSARMESAMEGGVVSDIDDDDDELDTTDIVSSTSNNRIQT
jgi:secreted trypsin-like serine protease